MLLETSTTTQTKPIRIVIADDHEFFMDGFCSAMRKHEQVHVAGRGSNGAELLELVEEIRPDIVFTDITMPVMDGIAATKQIMERFPYVKVIAYSGYLDECFITDMIDAGAMGYLLKNEPAGVILKAIENVIKGEVFYSHEVANKLAGMVKRTAMNPMKPFDRPHFSELEISVIKGICDQLSSKEIATCLGVETRSVESAKSRIMEKINCRNSAGIVKYAYKNYIVRF